MNLIITFLGVFISGVLVAILRELQNIRRDLES
jgi:hypothetical protein